MTDAAGAANPGEASDAGRLQLALLNILDDATLDRARLDDVQRGMLNILDDAWADRQVVEASQSALLNMLADAADDAERREGTHLAILNILDDTQVEKRELAEAEHAMLNLLEDFEQERAAGVVMNAELLHEVAEHMEAERSLQAKTEELNRSNADLEMFAYAASHDLSEPLRAVSGPVSLLARRYQGRLDADADQYIKFAVDGCQRMQNLIDDLLTYSRVGRPAVAGPVDGNDVLTGVLVGLSRAISERGAAVSAGPLPVVHAEATQLGQIFQNLVANALKFSDGGHPAVEIAAERSDHAWRFTVTDNGIGIAPQHRERIFGLFKRLHTRDQYPGTGMGLALVKKIVERLGGQIGVEDAPGGRGSRFWFTLPDPPETQP